MEISAPPAIGSATAAAAAAAAEGYNIPEEDSAASTAEDDDGGRPRAEPVVNCGAGIYAADESAGASTLFEMFQTVTACLHFNKESSGHPFTMNGGHHVISNYTSVVTANKEHIAHCISTGGVPIRFVFIHNPQCDEREGYMIDTSGYIGLSVSLDRPSVRFNLCQVGYRHRPVDGGGGDGDDDDAGEQASAGGGGAGYVDDGMNIADGDRPAVMTPEEAEWARRVAGAGAEFYASMLSSYDHGAAAAGGGEDSRGTKRRADDASLGPDAFSAAAAAADGGAPPGPRSSKSHAGGELPARRAQIDPGGGGGADGALDIAFDHDGGDVSVVVRVVPRRGLPGGAGDRLLVVGAYACVSPAAWMRLLC